MQTALSTGVADGGARGRRGPPVPPRRRTARYRGRPRADPRPEAAHRPRPAGRRRGRAHGGRAARPPAAVARPPPGRRRPRRARRRGRPARGHRRAGHGRRSPSPTTPTTRPRCPAGWVPGRRQPAARSASRAPGPPRARHRSSSPWPAGHLPTTSTCTRSTWARRASTRWPGSPTSARWSRPTASARPAWSAWLRAELDRRRAGRPEARPRARSWSWSTASAPSAPSGRTPCPALGGLRAGVRRRARGRHPHGGRGRPDRGYARRDAGAGPPAVAVPDGRRRRRGRLRAAGRGPAHLVPGRAVVAERTRRCRWAGPPRGSAPRSPVWPRLVAEPEPGRRPVAFGLLPREVDSADLVAAVRVGGGSWTIPVGVADATLGPATLVLHHGEHAVRWAVPGLGRTSLLKAVAWLVRAACPEATVVAVAGGHSALALAGVVHRVPSPDGGASAPRGGLCAGRARPGAGRRRRPGR